MTTMLLRLLRALLDSLPRHSTRTVAAAWQRGYFEALRVRRGRDGRFNKIST